MKRKIILPIVIVVLLCGGVVYFKAVTAPRPLILTGIVTTNDVVASSQVQGQLRQVLVKEGDTVKTGQLLAVIEPQELRADESYYLHTERGTAAQVEQAEAELKYQEAQTRDQIRQAEASLDSALAQEAEAKTNLELDRANYQRSKGLFDQNIETKQALDQTQATFEAQQSHVESLEKQVEVQRAAVALARSTEEQITVRRRQLQAMERQHAAANAQISKAQVRLD